MAKVQADTDPVIVETPAEKFTPAELEAHARVLGYRHAVVAGALRYGGQDGYTRDEAIAIIERWLKVKL